MTRSDDEPDERVREALEFMRDDASHGGVLAAEVRRLRRLQAAQREPVAEVVRNEPGGKVSLRWFIYVADGTKLYTQAQRDDHPTEGLLREARKALDGLMLDSPTDREYYDATEAIKHIDAALAASKGTPDFVSPVSSPDQTLPPPSAVAQWQPIESAPKRAEEVLVRYTDRYGNVRRVVAHWADGGGEEQPRFRGWFMAACDGFVELPHQPTHWMPLPEPPKDVRSQEEERP